MTESKQPAAAESTIPTGEIVHLHNQSVEIPADAVLYDIDAARTHGWNGAVKALIKLPASIKPGSSEDKEFAILDFGFTPPEGAPFFWNYQKGEPLRGQYRSASRFGLLATNHIPEGMGNAFIELPVGKGKTIGRENGLGSQLGLTGDEFVSGRHLTVGVDEHGDISIADHSMNGTVVEVPANQQ